MIRQWNEWFIKWLLSDWIPAWTFTNYKVNSQHPGRERKSFNHLNCIIVDLNTNELEYNDMSLVCDPCVNFIQLEKGIQQWRSLCNKNYFEISWDSLWYLSFRAWTLTSPFELWKFYSLTYIFVNVFSSKYLHKNFFVAQNCFVKFLN